jgi:predicted permease
VDLEKVRRLASVLISSQLRSGRSSSDPGAFTGKPAVIAVVDAGLFFGLFALAFVALSSLPAHSAAIVTAIDGVIPFLPLAAVGVVVIAGTMFELTATAKFSGSDAVNWMPLTPGEYVLASASAIAYTYSPATALLLGGLLAAAVIEGTIVVYLLACALTVLALVEGALLVEMIRSISTRAGSLGAGRRGPATFLLRAILLVVVILILDLAINPVFLYGAVERLSAFPTVSAVIPLFWSSRGLEEWLAGQYAVGAAFAAGQVAFVTLLGWAAARLRVRYWVPTATEVQLSEHQYAGSHAAYARLGLSRPESALVSKDFRGLVRRREMMPVLVIPVVLVLLLAIEGGGFGTFGTVLWVGWIAGFFGLLLSLTAMGQERRSIQQLFAFPITPRMVFRAKFTSVVVPVVIGSALLSLGVGLFARLSWDSLVGLLLLCTGVATMLTTWGLVFAARYSDFQDRPRPQFLRPSAMIAATLTGIALLSVVLVPGAVAVADPSIATLDFAITAAVLAVVIATVALSLARSGFDRLFRELPV